MFRLMTVIKNNSPRAWPSRVTTWIINFVLLHFWLANVLTDKGIAHLEDGRVGEEISMPSILLNISWKDEISGLDKSVP